MSFTEHVLRCGVLLLCFIAGLQAAGLAPQPLVLLLSIRFGPPSPPGRHRHRRPGPPEPAVGADLRHRRAEAVDGLQHHRAVLHLPGGRGQLAARARQDAPGKGTNCAIIIQLSLLVGVC